VIQLDHLDAPLTPHIDQEGSGVAGSNRKFPKEFVSNEMVPSSLQKCFSEKPDLTGIFPGMRFGSAL
jgi:hypothetical protein